MDKEEGIIRGIAFSVASFGMSYRLLRKPTNPQLMPLTYCYYRLVRVLWTEKDQRLSLSQDWKQTSLARGNIKKES